MILCEQAHTMRFLLHVDAYVEKWFLIYDFLRTGSYDDDFLQAYADVSKWFLINDFLRAGAYEEDMHAFA